MTAVFTRPKHLKPTSSGYCPGCLHGVANGAILQVLEEMNLAGKAIAVLPVGCAVLSAFYLDIDNVNAAHGRAPAVATGVKRCSPDSLVFSYQGDGDLASIGLAEIMHSANRGENFTAIFINNNIYGMTGGQMAPTTLVGQRATTSPLGRDPKTEGYPMKMCEIISGLEAPAYVARFALNTPQNIRKAKQGIRKAFEIQMGGGGFTFVELLSNCPTNWGLTPEKSLKWMEENTIPQFPLGEYKTPKEGR